MMKYFELDQEEQELLAEIERGEWKTVKNFAKHKKELMQIAKNTLNKTRNINIRLSERDLLKLKAKAAREGIPYQTLAASVIHRATTE
jgi:predicted DNA binding CopG/RHH family protein